MTSEGLFKPTVILFELTSFLVSFIDNIIVGTEEEECYDKVVEKVVKRLIENDLYIKLEKYK